MDVVVLACVHVNLENKLKTSEYLTENIQSEDLSDVSQNILIVP
jgi:hypothetical protein